jgi:predicted TPR repeat methyltransferase
MTTCQPSRGPAHFQRLYNASADPWNYRASGYEQAKYRQSVAILGTRHFRSGFEVGCSIGILTRLLACRCDALLGVDVIEKPLQDARELNLDQPHVRFLRMQVPGEWSDEKFDLIVLSEVLYFLSRTDLIRLADRVGATLERDGVVLLVNWRGKSDDPLTGDEAATLFIQHTRRWLSRKKEVLKKAYRLDLLRP